MEMGLDTREKRLSLLAMLNLWYEGGSSTDFSSTNSLSKPGSSTNSLSTDFLSTNFLSTGPVHQTPGSSNAQLG
jgi:hypothetical protein